MYGGFVQNHISIAPAWANIFGTYDGTGNNNIIVKPASLTYSINHSTEGTATGLVDSDKLYISSYNGSNKIFYINGVADKTEAHGGTPALTTLDLGIGADLRSGGVIRHFKGTLSSFIAGAAVGFDQTNYYADLVTLNTGLAAL